MRTQKKFKRARSTENGSAIVEYVLIIGMMTLMVIASINAFYGSLGKRMADNGERIVVGAGTICTPSPGEPCIE